MNFETRNFWKYSHIEGVGRARGLRNLLKTYVHHIMVKANLISADTWEKYYYELLVEDRKEFLGKN